MMQIEWKNGARWEHRESAPEDFLTNTKSAPLNGKYNRSVERHWWHEIFRRGRENVLDKLNDTPTAANELEGEQQRAHW